MSAARLAANFAAVAGASLMQACAMPAAPIPSPIPSPTVSGGCQARLAEVYIGRRPTPELAQSARMLAGGQTVRVLAHDQVVTREYMVDRLNIHLGPDGTIAQITCG